MSRRRDSGKGGTYTAGVEPPKDPEEPNGRAPERPAEEAAAAPPPGPPDTAAPLGRKAEAVARILAQPVPPVFVVAGSSMRPTIPPGSRVRVVPLAEPPVPGDVAVLEAAGRRTLHRVVHVVGDGETGLVFHAGDAPGGTGLAPLRAVIGKAVAILEPSDLPFPDLAHLPADVKRRYAMRLARCRAWATARRMATALRLTPPPAPGAEEAVRGVPPAPPGSDATPPTG